MMKLFISIIAGILFTGCAANVPSDVTYLEPLPAAVVTGPPAVVPPPPHIIVRPLPPVVLIPERHIYFYSDIYYYYWGEKWFYSEKETGPWHILPKRFYPPYMKKS